MDKKLRETTNLCVEIMNSNLVTWYTSSRLPSEVNVMLNLSIHSWMRDVENNQRDYWIAWNLVRVYGIEEPYLGTPLSTIIHSY